MPRAHDIGRSVGIELCSGLIRGVLLGDAGTNIVRASEVALTAHHDDRSVLDALRRVRADLGADTLPTRLAMFPSGSWMRRVDVTGRTGPELNGLRVEIDRRYGAASTLLVDDGSRRWLHVLHWPDAGVRRIEALAEQAGFVEVAVEPSPVALGRVLDDAVTLVERLAAQGESSATVLQRGRPVAAVSIDGTGRTHPMLTLSTNDFSAELFEGVVEADALTELINAIRTRSAESGRGGTTKSGVSLIVDGGAVPIFPPHDLRAPERQCVAVGAAVGAAGLVGRIRPVDIITGAAATTPVEQRPWVVERVTTVTPAVSSGPGVARRTVARLLPRRRR